MNHDHSHEPKPHHDHHHGRHDHHHGDKNDHDHPQHNHGVVHVHTTLKNLKMALILNLVFAIIEVYGGLWTGSVAILSDAIHDFGDAMALGVALLFEVLANRRATSRYTYGYRRLSLLSALLMGAFLLVGSSIILSKAVDRFVHPETPHLPGMVAFAVLGVLVNGYAALRLIKGKSFNEKVVSWHLIEDVFGWVTVLVGALVMMVVDVPQIDPILSIGFTLFMVYGVGRSLYKTTRLFLQATPEGIDIEALKLRVKKVPHVLTVHDTHLWSLDGSSHVLTLHVVVDHEVSWSHVSQIKKQVRAIAQDFGPIHTTIEIETQGEECDNCDR